MLIDPVNTNELASNEETTDSVNNQTISEKVSNGFFMKMEKDDWTVTSKMGTPYELLESTFFSQTILIQNNS